MQDLKLHLSEFLLIIITILIVKQLRIISIKSNLRNKFKHFSVEFKIEKCLWTDQFVQFKSPVSTNRDWTGI